MHRADATSAALEHVMGRFAGMVRSVGRSRGLGDSDLNELTQEVRLRIWRALADHEKIVAVNTSYVYRAAISAALDMVRRARARPVTSLDTNDVPPLREGPEAEFELEELVRQIDRAVSDLSEPRDVVVRLHLSGYSRAEIADFLGWSEPKVRNLLYRGLSDLRRLLIQEGIHPQSYHG